MAQLIFTERAVADLDDIWRYTLQTWSVEQADKYYNIIKEACHNIADGTATGKSYQDIEMNLLGYHVKKHLVFYQMVADDVEIIRILHERMDYKNRLGE